MPAFISLHRAQRPVEEVTHVGKDLDWLAAAAAEVRKALGSAIDGACGTIREAGNRVAKKFAFLVHIG